MNTNGEILRIEQIKVKDLYRFTLDYLKNREKSDIEFISIQRALAQSNNPYATEDDIGMILAYKGSTCIGYLGLMPGLMRFNKVNIKIIWPTCMYISPEYRGESISSKMINTAYAINKIIVITGMGPMSEPIFNHLNFLPLKKADFFEISIQRFFLSILPLRIINKVLKYTSKFILKNKNHHFAFYEIIKTFIYRTLKNNNVHNFGDISFEEIPYVDETFVNRLEYKDYCFPRPIECINWMLKYKWVLSKNEANGRISTYYFSNYRDIFRYIVLKWQSAESTTINGFLILSVSIDKGRTKIKLLDHTCDNEIEGKLIVNLILKYASEIRADSIEIPFDIKKYFNKSLINGLLFTDREWRFVYHMSQEHKTLTDGMEKIITKCYDGDIAFV